MEDKINWIISPCEGVPWYVRWDAQEAYEKLAPEVGAMEARKAVNTAFPLTGETKKLTAGESEKIKRSLLWRR